MSMLLAKWVRRQDISSEEVFDPTLSSVESGSGTENFDDLFLDMVIWLRDEGFVRYEGVYDGTNNETCFSQVSPTAFAMRVLDQTVQGTTTGRDLVEKKLDGDDVSRWAKLGAFIGGFVGGASQSLG